MVGGAKWFATVGAVLHAGAHAPLPVLGSGGLDSTHRLWHLLPNIYETQKQRKTFRFTSNQPHISCFVSPFFQLLPPKSANATQSQTNQWVHVHPSSPTPFTTDRMLTVYKLFLQISPTECTLPHVHSHPNILSSLSSYAVGTIWQTVLKWRIQKKISRVSNRVFASPWRPGFDSWHRRGAWWETVITMGLHWLSNRHTNNV